MSVEQISSFSDLCSLWEAQQGASKSRAKDLWPGDGENLEGRLCEGGRLWLDGKIGANGTLLIPLSRVSEAYT